MNDVQIAFLTNHLGFKHPEAPKENDGLSDVKFQKIRLAYIGVRKAAFEELRQLEAAINVYFSKEADAAEMAGIASRVYDGLSAFDDRLVETLDKAMNVEGVENRKTLEFKAVRLVEEYLAALDEHPILKILDDNPIKPIAVKAKLKHALSVFATQLRGV